MRSVFVVLSFLVFLSVPSFGGEGQPQSLTCLTTPATAEISFPGEYYGYDTDFTQLNDGGYALAVNVQSYVDPRDTETEAALFSPKSGVIHRVGDNLIWTVDGRDIQIAHTRWWYSVWVPESNVKVNVTAVPNTGTGSGFTVYDITADFTVD